ncbi:DgyrCDS10017 [Dimorphilus gyrociliatus]|uniref:DgyrCDS10017 n=1 Tax=Dimorphilus gyrociliatus TaxID=2664684 RepID=A0A7I8VYW1_9ANNE|nr:DgyrCDS10017 [Dimorphilus gyrociliatus]
MTDDPIGGSFGIFPSITICNNFPFSMDKINRLKLPTIDEFYTKVDKAAEAIGGSNRFLEGIKSIGGYFSYLGINNVKKVAHKKDELFLECKVILLEGYLNDYRNCTTTLLSRVDRYLHPDYFACYTIRPLYNESYSDGLTSLLLNGLQTVLHLKESGENLSFNGSKGAKFTVHQPDAWFNVKIHGHDVRPSSMTTAQIAGSADVKLEKPYGNCYNSSFIEPVKTLEGYNLMYSSSACYALCKLKAIAENCQCIDPYQLISPDHINKYRNYSLCHKLPDVITKESIEKFVNRLQCREREVLKAEKTCIPTCRPPCLRMVYKVDLGEGIWPDKRQVMSVYEGLILNKVFHKDYLDYYDIFKKWSTTKEPSDILLNKKNRLEKNLILLKFYWMSQTGYFSRIDQKVYDAADLFSQIGGILNLWTGITFILLVEIFEFLYRLFMLKTAKKAEERLGTSLQRTRTALNLIRTDKTRCTTGRRN